VEPAESSAEGDNARITVSPRRGVVPADGFTEVTFTFRPTSLVTYSAQFAVNVSQVSFLGDAESSLVGAKSSLGDATSSLGDATSTLGDAKSSLGDGNSSLGDAKSSLGDAKSSLGDA
jgi:hypothetical protein